MSAPSITSPEAVAEFEKLEPFASEEALRDALAVNRTVKLLQERFGLYFVVHVELKNVERNEKTADWGDFIYRKWSPMEVIEQLTSPFMQQTEKEFVSPGMGRFEPKTKENEKGLFEMKCEYIAKAAHPELGLTKERLLTVGDYGWVQFVWTWVWEHSGAGGRLGKDLQRFFR